MLYHSSKVKDLARALQALRVQLTDIRMAGLAEQFLVAFQNHPELRSLQLKATFMTGDSIMPMAHGHVKVLLCSLVSEPHDLSLNFDLDVLCPEVVGEGSYAMRRDDPGFAELLALFEKDPDEAIFKLSREMNGCFLPHEHGTNIIQVNAKRE